MTPFERLQIAVMVLRPAEGWRCIRLTNTKIVMRHDVHGDRVCWVSGSGALAVRGGIPGEEGLPLPGR